MYDEHNICVLYQASDEVVIQEEIHGHLKIKGSIILRIRLAFYICDDTYYLIQKLQEDKPYKSETVIFF